MCSLRPLCVNWPAKSELVGARRSVEYELTVLRDHSKNCFRCAMNVS